MAQVRLIPALAAKIAEVFSELNGRSIAVSEVDAFDNKTNIPTLPLAVTALLSEEATQSAQGISKTELISDILVQFIFEPVKYKREDKADTPFFAFYDYESIRDRMLEMAVDWKSPRGGHLVYRSLDVESDEFGVYIAFRLRTTERWCRPEAGEPPPITVVSRMCAATCDPGPEECQPVDPCNLA